MYASNSWIGQLALLHAHADTVVFVLVLSKYASKLMLKLKMTLMIG